MICKAKVYDLNKFDIKDFKSDKPIALDTNVLYWMHYSRCGIGGNLTYQIQIYPDVIEQLKESGFTLVTTIYNVTELLYIIERHEFEIYNLSNKKIGLKDYRQISTERENIKKELSIVKEQIKLLYEIFEYPIEIIGIDKFIDEFSSHCCDNFDYLILKYLKERGVNQIIADDRDYTSMENITLYTANKKSIILAQSESMLIN